VALDAASSVNVRTVRGAPSAVYGPFDSGGEWTRRVFQLEATKEEGMRKEKVSNEK
jgi:hypothetical protein